MVDNEGTRLENGISDFCFPNGLKLCRGIQMPKFFCFVLTDAEVSMCCNSCALAIRTCDVFRDGLDSRPEWHWS